MKRIWVGLAAVVGLTAFMSHDAVAQNDRNRDRDGGRDEVCVYEHSGYGGWEKCFGVGDDVRDLGNLRNQISSVRIRGRAEITLYEHPNFQGREVSIDSSVPDLRQIAKF